MPEKRKCESELYRRKKKTCQPSCHYIKSCPNNLLQITTHDARSRIFSPMRQQAPFISAFSIDQPPPSFGTNNTSFGSGLGFWEDGKLNYSLKRKLSDEYFHKDLENKPSKKSKINPNKNSLVLSSTMDTVNRRKRMREIFETDTEERKNKKKKMEIYEPEPPGTHAKILAPRGRKRRNTNDNILLTKRRRTNDREKRLTYNNWF